MTWWAPGDPPQAANELLPNPPKGLKALPFCGLCLKAAALVLVAIELIFFIAGMGLCFVFMIKIVLITH